MRVALADSSGPGQQAGGGGGPATLIPASARALPLQFEAPLLCTHSVRPICPRQWKVLPQRCDSVIIPSARLSPLALHQLPHSLFFSAYTSQSLISCVTCANRTSQVQDSLRTRAMVSLIRCSGSVRHLVDYPFIKKRGGGIKEIGK